jgi:CTP synthase
MPLANRPDATFPSHSCSHAEFDDGGIATLPPADLALAGAASSLSASSGTDAPPWLRRSIGAPEMSRAVDPRAAATPRGGAGTGGFGFPNASPSSELPETPTVTGLLSDQADKSTNTEFFSPIPTGYRRGQHKYVAVFGTVMSGLGKGIFASSCAKLLKDKGLVVAPIKLEGYLNVDAGTLNPYRHGEVFVLNDGTECDMDLGTYERVLDQDLSRRNFMTSGQIFSTIVTRERQGAYLGRDVQMIPHVTGEVKRRIRELAMYGDGQRPADVVFVEVGGTVGDYENGFYIEALRELAFEEGEGAVAFVALTYVIKPQVLGEQKSKAAQLGIKRLMEAGIQPHILACRATDPVSEQVRQKIAMFSNVPMKRVFSMHDRESIYTIPDDLRSTGIDREILSILDLHDRVDVSQEDRHRKNWSTFVEALTRPKTRQIAIGLTGKYVAMRDAYASIDKAVEHCSAHLGCEVDLRWIETTDIDPRNVSERLQGLDAVIVPGGFGRRGVEGKIACVRHCRERQVPYLGICLGFQVAVIEFARNVCGLTDAGSTEFDTRDARTPHPVISELPEQKKIEGLGGTMRLGGQDVEIRRGTLASFLYLRARSIIESGDVDGVMDVRERFRHRYEVDPRYIDQLEAGGLIFSGRHPDQPIMQVLELPPLGEPGGHPFFIAGQFHPELTSRPLHPQPLFMGLLAAALHRKYGEAILGAGSTVTSWVRTPRRQPQTA